MQILKSTELMIPPFWWYRHYGPISRAIWMPVKQQITATHSVVCWHRLCACSRMPLIFKDGGNKCSGLVQQKNRLFFFLTIQQGRKEQIMCDLATAAVASVIWEQTRMGGTCQVQWEFQVKWVMFSPAVSVFVCVSVCWGVGAGLGGGWCVCAPRCWTSGRLFEVPRWIVLRQLHRFPPRLSERRRELDKQKVPLDLQRLPLLQYLTTPQTCFLFLPSLHYLPLPQPRPPNPSGSRPAPRVELFPVDSGLTEWAETSCCFSGWSSKSVRGSRYPKVR